MQVDSDTEPESGDESSFVLPGATSQLSLPILEEDQCMTAIQIIRNACMAELPTNVEGRTKVLEAAIKVVQFLDSMLESRNDLGDLIGNIIPLVEPGFLSNLFDHRKIFRRIATQQLLPVAHNASMVVCWVDSLLVKLSEITSLMAGGLVRATQSESVFLMRRREHDTLMAATQLPDSWSSVASVLDGPHSSPAARRLALRLLFAVCMVGPWLSGSDPWSDPENISPLDLLRVLDRYISQSSSNAWTYVSELDCTRERLTFSMTLSLYAAADTEDRRCRNHCSPLRPRTLGSLLNYIHYIVSPPNTPAGENTTWLTSSLEVLDPPQTLLLRWRETVLWCWQTWKDSRTANSDNVIHMTAQWLFHCDTEKISTGIGAMDFKRMLRIDPRACSAAITRLLHELVDALLVSPGLISQDLRFYALISKTTKTFLHLFRENFTDQDIQRSGDTQEVFKYLASLFILLPEEGECSTTTIKYSLLEASTLLDVAVVRHVLPSLCKDKKLAFTEKIDDLMFRTRKYLTRKTEEPHSDEVIRVNLDFISFVWHNTEKGVLHCQALAPFISALLEYLRPETGGFAFNSAMSCFSVLDVHPSCDIKHHKADLWRACLQAPCSNLPIAASFAYSILHLDSLTHVNDVLCSQAFNHLRGSLALTIRGDFIDKDEPVALSVSTLFCSAMLRLLDAELPALTYMILCPWTKTLCVNLKALLHSDCPNTSYRGILKRRLVSTGNRLLNLIEGKNDGSESSQNPHVDCRLIMCETFDVPSLIFIPGE